MTQLASNMLAVLVLALVAEFATRVLWRRPAIGQLLWLAVLVRSLLPSLPLLTFWQEQISLGIIPLSTATILPAQAPNAVASWFPSNLELLLGAWCLGSLWHAARAHRRTRHLRRRVALGQRSGDASCARVRAIASELRLQAPALVTLPGITSPFLIGLRRPTLVLPEPMEHGDANALSAVMLHELVHLERRDLWTAWIELLAECLWWWNPVVRYAIAQSRRYRELACDARVMELKPDARHAYATALLDSAGAPTAQRLPAELASWVGSGSRIRERLRCLYLDSRQARVSRMGFATVAALLCCTLLGFAHTSHVVPQAGTQELTETDLRNLARFEVNSYEELESRSLARLESTPTDGRSWYELGWAYSGLQDIGAASAAFERQYELSYQPTIASYNLACCYSMLGDIDAALSWIQRSVSSGYDNYDGIERDGDLRNLHGDARFQAWMDSLRVQNPSAAQ